MPTTTPLPAPEGWIAQRWVTTESGPDYVCPRCHRTVARRVQHVVAWPTDGDGAHRHWHSNCWTAAVREGIDRYRFI